MFTLTKWIAAPALALGFMFAGDAPKAEAQYGHHGYYGNYGYGWHGGRGISININRGGYLGYPYRSYSPYYGHGRGSYFHDTSHYHYYPTEIIRHGNHYHVVPGHYHLHRSGHFH